jgi:hypothetical protein
VLIHLSHARSAQNEMAGSMPGHLQES